jgi:hypothetical protein
MAIFKNGSNGDGKLLPARLAFKKAFLAIWP